MNGKTIFDLHHPGSNRRISDNNTQDVYDPVQPEFLRTGIDLPDVSESEVIRHYTSLSRMNFGVDNGTYPLGSCTMKHNPRINESVAGMAGFTGIHPMSGDDSSQGILEIMYNLTEYLKSLTGMDAFTLCPAAGAHGELTGVMIIHKYFKWRKEKRSVILIPDTAHGTNPASVAMCGFTAKEIPSDRNGNVDLDELKKSLDEDVAALMLTCPNTLGLFDTGMEHIAAMLHANGSLLYGDGANFNALIGQVRPRDLGFDILHLNLHKTFSTPHGGGGPGAGPVGVISELEHYLPVPFIKKDGERYSLSMDRKDTIGRIHSFLGNTLVCLKAYAYIRMMGKENIRRISEDAVLNANYLLHRLREHFHVPYDRRCMHEFVISDKKVPNQVSTNDIAKRILDYGFHAPTVYFPLLVHGAIMIEPTETESLANIERLIETLEVILTEASKDPEMVKTSPHTTPVKRVDAVSSARKPVITWDQMKYVNPAG